MELAAVSPEQLTIGASNFDAPPMTDVEDGQRLGDEPDMAPVVCAKRGLQPGWLSLPTVEFYTLLQAKTGDVVWFNQVITPAVRHARGSPCG